MFEDNKTDTSEEVEEISNKRPLLITIGICALLSFWKGMAEQPYYIEIGGKIIGALSLTIATLLVVTLISWVVSYFVKSAFFKIFLTVFLIMFIGSCLVTDKVKNRTISSITNIQSKTVIN